MRKQSHFLTCDGEETWCIFCGVMEDGADEVGCVHDDDCECYECSGTSHPSTRFVETTRLNGMEVAVDHGFNVDTPESLGDWALELGGYHHRTPYCLEITHANEISGCIATAHNIVP